MSDRAISQGFSLESDTSEWEGETIVQTEREKVAIGVAKGQRPIGNRQTVQRSSGTQILRIATWFEFPNL